MGKKIPSKKHNKLKSVDPFNRKANSNVFKREDETKNLAPKKLTQEVPGSMKRLFDIDDIMDEQPKRKRKKKTNRITIRTLNHRDDTASLVSQNTYETDEQFLKRVSQMANRARERADISAKFDVHFNEDGTFEHEVPEGTTLPTRKKRRLLEYKEKQKARLMKLKVPRGDDVGNKGPIKEFPGREQYTFGEVVHAPPEITAKLRGAPERDPKKTARSLLCNPDNMKKASKSVDNAACDRPEQVPNEDKEKKTHNARPKTDSVAGLEKIRWKKLEASKRAELEAERKRAIEAYRKLKNKT